MKKNRIAKETSRLIERLIQHLEILIDFSDKAFYEYQHDKYAGEVAGKLRILVINLGWKNKPLLLDLMKHFEYERSVKDLVRGEYTLETYIYELSGDGLTNEEIIRSLAEQQGSAHEDWEICEKLHKALYESRALVNRTTPWSIYKLRGLANIVLQESVLFLFYLHEKGILEKLKVNYTLRQILNIGTLYPDELDFNLENRKKRKLQHIKPTKKALDLYNHIYLLGKADLMRLNFDGLTPKEEIRKNGFKTAYWMPNKLINKTNKK